MSQESTAQQAHSVGRPSAILDEHFSQCFTTHYCGIQVWYWATADVWR